MTTKDVQAFSQQAESPLAFSQLVIQQTRLDICQQLCRRCKEEGAPTFTSGVWRHEDKRCDAEEAMSAVLTIVTDHAGVSSSENL